MVPIGVAVSTQKVIVQQCVARQEAGRISLLLFTQGNFTVGMYGEKLRKITLAHLPISVYKVLFIDKFYSENTFFVP